MEKQMLGFLQMPKAFCPFEHWLEGYHSFDEVGKVYNPSVYPLEILISQNSRSKTQRLFQAVSGKSFERIRYVSRVYEPGISGGIWRVSPRRYFLVFFKKW